MNENTSQRKYLKILIIAVVIAILLWLSAISLAVLAPFLVGILLAYMLMPVVTWLEKLLPPKGKAFKTRRVLSVSLVFGFFALVLGLSGVYMGASLAEAATTFIEKVPGLISQSIGALREWIVLILSGLPHSFVDPFMANLAPSSSKFVQDFIAGTIIVVPATMPTIMGFLTLPFFMFFVMSDYESFQKFFYKYLPPVTAEHTANILGIIGTSMGRYLRSQLILGILTGAMVCIGLVIMQVDYAVVLGFITTVMQLIPILGPVISVLLILAITLALQPAKILWVLILLMGVQAVVNMILVNLIQGKYMQIHPAVIMVLVVVGGYVGGLLGTVLALPMGATVWEIFKYFSQQGTATSSETTNSSLA